MRCCSQEAPHYRCGGNAPSIRFIKGSPRLAVARIRHSFSCIFCSLSNPISIFRRTVFWGFQTIRRRAGRSPLTTSALTIRRLFFHYSRTLICFCSTVGRPWAGHRLAISRFHMTLSGAEQFLGNLGISLTVRGTPGDSSLQGM